MTRKITHTVKEEKVHGTLRSDYEGGGDLSEMPKRRLLKPRKGKQFQDQTLATLYFRNEGKNLNQIAMI